METTCWGKLQAAIEPDIVDKYTVCVLKNNEVIGRLPKGTDGKSSMVPSGQTSMDI